MTRDQLEDAYQLAVNTCDKLGKKIEKTDSPSLARRLEDQLNKADKHRIALFWKLDEMKG